MRKRTDNNQREIVEALRAIGATVESLANVGSGCPDLLVGYGRNFLIEVKGAEGKLTPAQVDWHARWQGQVAVVRSAQEAIDVVRAAVVGDTVERPQG